MNKNKFSISLGLLLTTQLGVSAASAKQQGPQNQTVVLSSREVAASFDYSARTFGCLPAGSRIHKGFFAGEFRKKTELGITTAGISGVPAPAVSENIALLTGLVKSADPSQQILGCPTIEEEIHKLFVDGKKIPIKVKQTLSKRFESHQAAGAGEACVEVIVQSVEVEFGRFVFSGESSLSTTNACPRQK